MDRDFPRDWMWSEACAMLARAEQLNREFFRPVRSQRQLPVWEPPVDVLETDHEVLVLVALPGVDTDSVDASIEGSNLLFSGMRVLLPELRTAVIHRLELPQGRFERRVPLPIGNYTSVKRSAGNGLLMITLQKAGS